MTSTAYQFIRVTLPRPFVTLITLHRPDAKNALSTGLLGEISAALAHAGSDDAVRAVVLTGGADIFAAGADLKELARMGPIDMLGDSRPGYWRDIRLFPKPLIAAVNGFALGGGCELAMHADIVVAGEGTRFGQPEVNLGTIPGAGATQRLMHTIGKPLAMRMILTGESVDALTAHTWGLVSIVSPPQQTIDKALDLAEEIAAKSPLAIRLAKEAMLKAHDMPMEVALQFERKSFSLLAASDDRREGITAFLEKRRPVFSGR